MDVLKIFLIDVFANDLNQIGVALKLYLTHVLYIIDIVDDVDIMGRYHLSAIIPIGLVAVIFLGIVRGGDVHTTLAP